MNKAEKLVTNPTTIVPECYHDFLDIFSKKTSDKVLFHSKYDYKTELLEQNKDHGQAAFHGMLKPQLKIVKKFLKKYLKKALLRLTELSVHHQSY